MNFLAVTLVGVTFGQPPISTPDYYPMNSRNIRIPIRYEKDRKAIRQVKLYVARNGENTWYQEGAVPPDRDYFNYYAKEDGLYWFTMMEEDLQGRNIPADLTRTPPDLKVIVDTVPPKVHFTNARKNGEETVVEWYVDDKYPDESATRVHFRPVGSDGPWTEVTLPANSRSGVRFSSGVSGPVVVRVTAFDLAGNKTEQVREIEVTGGSQSAGSQTGGGQTSSQTTKSHIAGHSSATDPTGSTSPQAGMTAGPATASDAPLAPVGPPPDKSPSSTTATGFTGAVPPPDLGPVAPTAPTSPPQAASSQPNPASSGASGASGEPVGPIAPITPPVVPAGVAGIGGQATGSSASGANLTPIAPTVSSSSAPSLTTSAQPHAQPNADPRHATAQALPSVGMGEANLSGPTPVAVWTSGNAPATPSVEVNRVQYINFWSFDMAYEVESRGPSGISRLDLWVTRDDGRTWLKWSQHDGKAATVRVNLNVPNNPQPEGAYGFRVVPVSGAGLSEREPVSGDPPDLRVIVDVTPPTLDLYRPVGDPNNPDALVIQWKATDANFGEDPITIEWSDKPTGPWQPTAAAGELLPAGASPLQQPRRLPNSGQFSWRVPAGLPPRVYLKVSARDAAGNVREVITREPVLVDLVKPRAKISGIITPATGAVIRP